MLASRYVPNLLSTLRLLMAWIPWWILVTTSSTSWTWRLIALFTFAIIASSDLLDGYLARKWDCVSTYGKVVDPLADKAIITLTMIGICLTTPLFRGMGWILLIMIFLRESSVSIVRAVKAHRHNIIIPANKDGKKKMMLQSLAIMCTFLPTQETAVIAWLLFGASLPYSLSSARAYITAK